MSKAEKWWVVTSEGREYGPFDMGPEDPTPSEGVLMVLEGFFEEYGNGLSTPEEHAERMWTTLKGIRSVLMDALEEKT